MVDFLLPPTPTPLIRPSVRTGAPSPLWGEGLRAADSRPYANLRRGTGHKRGRTAGAVLPQPVEKSLLSAMRARFQQGSSRGRQPA